MLIALLMLLGSQLIGESVTRLLGLPVPGPVLGLLLLAAGAGLSGRLREAVEPTATGLLRNLSLLFVPAGVGIVQHLPRLASEGLAIGGAIVFSTTLTLAVTALTFQWVARRLGTQEER